MKRILILCLAFAIASPLFAQQVQQVPLIEVEGFAERKISPDEALFGIFLEEKAMNVSDAVNTLNRKTQNLADALKKARIKDFQLVADNYAVNVNRIYRSGVARDSGYVATQNLRIVTSSTNEDLQKIVDAIQNAGDMSYNLNFGISEKTKKSLENTLLTEALRDAEARAQLIGQTLGIRSLRVFHVTLSNDSPRPMYMMNARAESEEKSSDMLIETEEQSISKRVFVKYTY